MHSGSNSERNAVGTNSSNVPRDEERAARGGTNEDAKAEDETPKEEERATVVNVPTKTHDGGSQEASIGRDGRPDLFTRLTNQNVRMNRLLGDGDDEDQGNADWQLRTGFQGMRRLRAGSDPDERKTRVSTELHPDTLLFE